MVDVFKRTGRLHNEAPPKDSGSIQFEWAFRDCAVKSFSEIIGNKLEPVHAWFPRFGTFESFKTDMKDIKEELKDNFWMTDEGKKLEQKIKNCNNQCYNCHLCERAFSVPDIDSLIEL